MSVREFKILMYIDENEVYHIYDSKTASVQEHDKESVDSIVKSGEYIRYMKKRRRIGTCAVIYKVNPKRYIVVDPRGKHAFRTFNEIASESNKYFNVEVYNESLKPLDGTIQKADIYMENLTYKDIYSDTPFDIEVNKDTGIASIIKCRLHRLEVARPYNFISRLESYCFAGMRIDTFECHDTVKVIKDYAFYGCTIGRFTINNDKIDIEKHAFDNATIGSLEITNCAQLFYDNTFSGANVGVLDLEFSKMSTINYKTIKQMENVDKIILPPRIPSLNIDKLLGSVKAIEFTGKLPNLICNSDKLKSKIISEYTRIKKDEKVVSLLDLESNA